MLDATNFLAFLQTEQSIKNGEFTLSSLDKLFNAHITDHISTEKASTPSPLCSNFIPILSHTKTHLGAPKRQLCSTCKKSVLTSAYRRAQLLDTKR